MTPCEEDVVEFSGFSFCDKAFLDGVGEGIARYGFSAFAFFDSVLDVKFMLYWVTEPRTGGL